MKSGGVGGRKRSRAAAAAAAAAAATAASGTVAAAGGGGAGKDDGDRLDGRAGPKSENVVLQKTIDHIRAQLDERQRLKARLERARSTLPPSHPLVEQQQRQGSTGSENGGTQVPPWERPWYGGKNDDEGGSEEE